MLRTVAQLANGTIHPPNLTKHHFMILWNVATDLKDPILTSSKVAIKANQSQNPVKC